MTYDDIKVSETGTVEVVGPKDFVDSLDWPKVERVAMLFAPFASSAANAIKQAVWQQYAAWNGMRSLLSRKG